MSKINVDPELRDYLPEHDDATRAAHTAAILSARRADRPIVVWQERNVVLDGHHTLAVCEAHGIPYLIEPISLPDVAAAKAWMLERQLSRRNMTRDQWLARKALDGTLTYTGRVAENQAMALAKDASGRDVLLAVLKGESLQCAYNDWVRSRKEVVPRASKEPWEHALARVRTLKGAQRKAFVEAYAAFVRLDAGYKEELGSALAQ